jgi:hypothetical protein
MELSLEQINLLNCFREIVKNFRNLQKVEGSSRHIKYYEGYTLGFESACKNLGIPGYMIDEVWGLE